ncbi:hypothetical protein IQ250_29760, partial [Pseudanabaenaceae cyanobacterium LEGE 13415]|nr:hypothetical protein [Pseudanabaenaceae cyanobacterium LEGE 13415]
MRYLIRKFLTWLRVLVVLVIILSLGLFVSSPAAAEVRQLEEATGQR